MTEEDRKLFKKFSGSIKREIDYKKELMEALEENSTYHAMDTAKCLK